MTYFLFTVYGQEEAPEDALGTSNPRLKSSFLPAVHGQEGAKLNYYVYMEKQEGVCGK